MALIELRKPHSGDNHVDTYLDLTDGSSGRRPLAKLDRLAGHGQDALLCTGITSAEDPDIMLSVYPLDVEFDDITFETAAGIGANNFERMHIEGIALDAGSRFLIRTATDPVRYFKAYVRNTPYALAGNPAFSSAKTTLEFEELVEKRMIWPLGVILRNDRLTVLNPITESRHVPNTMNEFMFTLRPESFVGSEGPNISTPARDFYDNPFPIARVVFEQNETVVEPRAIESVEIAANFSQQYVNSTYLIRLNDGGRRNGVGDQAYKFTVHLVDREIAIREWDPEVIIDEH